MLRLVGYLLGVLLLASSLSWLADRPGSVLITWQKDYEIQVSLFQAVVALLFLFGAALALWSLARQLWRTPAIMGHFVHRQRHKRGLEALSSGMIAVGAGDKALAIRSAVQARKALPNEPLTQLLRAQAAQLSGDKQTSRRIYESMLASPETEQLGLRGLFLEAEREHEPLAARQFAERALALNPKLGWSADALFSLQCIDSDWAGALDTLAIAKRNGTADKHTADRRRAVLLTAQAQEAEDRDPAKAVELAREAHDLAHDLVPAAAILGRLYASRGNTPKAARVLLKTWKRSPHPDLATAYAYARPGDSPRDRLARVQELSRLSPHNQEGAIAVAIAAIDARAWDEARTALKPLLDSRLTQRAATLMARIEDGQHADRGKVREWLARTVNAPRDPAWTADGYVSERWMPVSPVTGELDAFQWKVPAEPLEKVEGEHLTGHVEKLVGLGQRVAGPIGDAHEVDPATTIEVVPNMLEPATVKPAAAAPAKSSPSTKATPAAQPSAASTANRGRVLDPKTGKFVEDAAKSVAPAADLNAATEKPAPITAAPTVVAPPPAKAEGKPVVAANTAVKKETDTMKQAPAVSQTAKSDPAKMATSGAPNLAAAKPGSPNGGGKKEDGRPQPRDRKGPSEIIMPRPPDDPGPDVDGEEVRPR